MILKNFNQKKMSVAQMKNVEGGNANGWPGTPYSDEVVFTYNGRDYTRRAFPFFGFTDEQKADYLEINKTAIQAGYVQTFGGR
ncbi:hypothetical protein [Chryseobacterium fistulae]|uniref:Uncharacterized protein n=1 Tax=Chryseobacterium fistulae TaxID=2675058 RepID=A0A6N4XMN0_9FLAO|nr:hypothetical protein [Chryseobacterium fistulae]CAA7387134.1 hypothetical protein CHRY9393_01440 [Chryseobacterium fistulae]